MSASKVRQSLVKLLVAIIVLVLLTLICFGDIDPGLRGTIATFVVVVVFPVSLLLGIDASRVIKREMPGQRSLRLLGKALALPQAIMGTVLVGFAVVYPLFGIRELVSDISNGVMPALPVVRICIAAFSFIVGLHYVREGLGLTKRNK